MPRMNELGHFAVVPPVVVRAVPRMEPVWWERFATSSSSDVADAVGKLYTMAAEIGPLYRPAPMVVGQALTVKCWPGDNLAVFGALAMAQDGDVLVVDTRGYTGACGSGSQALRIPRDRGLRGVVIDGAWRDVDVLEDEGFAIYGRARSSFSPTKRYPGEINVPVSCGGVVVQPGDLVLGDGDGVVVVPARHIEPVWASLVERRERNEDAAAASASTADRRAEYYAQHFAAAGGEDRIWA